MEAGRHHRHKHKHYHRKSTGVSASDVPSNLLKKHKSLMTQYKRMQSQNRVVDTKQTVTDADAISKHHQFIMEDDLSKAKDWEERVAIRYYKRLFKEYALVDLTYYRINKIGMRWRTENEVVDGKGQFSCGNIHCSSASANELCSYEVPFRYKETNGKSGMTLVKVRLCGPCALKLFYKKIREYESADKSRKRERQSCETSSAIFEYITKMLKSEEEIEQPTILASHPTIERKVERIEARSEAKPTAKPKVKSIEPKTKEMKTKTKKGHTHYSSSESESSGEEEIETEEKEVDGDGNEVISTSNDVWKTNVEVEHTEQENIDEFINQLFM